MRRLQLLFLVVGLAALTWLVVRLGPEHLLSGLKIIGWGFALTTFAHLTGLVLDSVTLRACAGKAAKSLGLAGFIRASISGHAINEATPLGKLGEVTKYAVLREQLPPATSAGALVAQNIVMFVTNCGLIALVAPVAVGLLGVTGPMAWALTLSAVLFFVLGLAGLLVLSRGLGTWPFAVASKLGVATETVSKWRDGWQAIEATWRDSGLDPGLRRTAWLSAIASRSANLLEAVLLLHFLGAEQVWAAALISLAGYQLVAWIFSFIPMQAGTAEGGAYVVFAAVGLNPTTGVMVELGRRIRRIVFVTLGVTVLAVSASKAHKAST